MNNQRAALMVWLLVVMLLGIASGCRTAPAKPELSCESHGLILQGGRYYPFYGLRAGVRSIDLKHAIIGLVDHMGTESTNLYAGEWLVPSEYEEDGCLLRLIDFWSLVYARETDRELTLDSGESCDVRVKKIRAFWSGATADTK